MTAGRRPEHFPEARERDRRVLEYLENDWHGLPHMRNKASRNTIAYDLNEDDPRKIKYALHRLRRRGLVKHVAKGNEGHGYWALTDAAVAAVLEES
jgi:predicted MarR family transcription regulator